MSLTTDIVCPEEPEVPEHHEDDTIVRRQLVNDFGPASTFHMKVYLRVRPLNNRDADTNKCLTIESDQSVVLAAPLQSATFRNHSSNEEKLKQRFTFTRVFGPDQNQREFFNGAVLGTVSEFVNGQNCLVFAYGTTNSGKTYTVQGSSSRPGVIPHAVEVVFNSVGNRLDNQLNLRPVNTCHVEQMPRKSITEMMATKDSLLSGIDEFYTSLSNQCSEDSTSSFDLTCKDGVLNDVSIHESENLRFRIWCSFAEIYNENIYDLLDSHPEQRKKLRLTLDVSGNNYIKGLKILPVSSPKEARQFLSLGRKNLHIASTKLNQSSSRSHCIFTIYLVRVVDTPDPSQAMINSLSFCDLAGSERVVKTQNTGDRLKEAGKINNSLMVFGRCIEALKTAQNSRDRPIIPFRDSKLTQLFQLFFIGKGRASMIVNVSPTGDMFDDTTNVLKVSAIAKQVVSDQLEKSCLNITSASQRLTEMWTKSGQRWSSFCKGKVLPSKMSIMTVKEDSVIEEQEEEVDTQSVEEEPDVQELIDLVLELEGKYNALVEEKAQQEVKLRAELCQEFQTIFVNMEKSHEKQLEMVKENAEEYTEKRLELAQKALLLNTKYLSEDSQEDEEDEDMDREELEALQSELTELKTEKETLEVTVLTLTEEVGNKSKELESLNLKLAEEVQSKQDLLLRLENKSRQLEDVTSELAETKEKTSASVASMAQEIEEKRLAIESLLSKQNSERDQADIERDLQDLRDSAQTAQQSLVKENNRLQNCVTTMQQEHSRRVKQLEEEIQKLSVKLSETEVSLEQTKCSSDQKYTTFQQVNSKKIASLEKDINRLTIKLTDTQSDDVQVDVNKKVLLLEEELLKTKQSLQSERSQASALKSAVQEAEEKYNSSILDLEKLGDILFDKDAEISSLSCKVRDLEKEVADQQKIKSEVEELRKQCSELKQKTEEISQEKEREIGLLKAKIATLERINTSDDFKQPVTKTRRRRRAGNENSAPADDLSQYSSSNQGDDSIVNKSNDSSDLREDSRTSNRSLAGTKRSSPVLSSRNLMDNVTENSRSKSSSDEDKSQYGGTMRKQRRKMYEKDNFAPLECSPPQQDNRRTSVHTIVTRQLRSRK